MPEENDRLFEAVLKNMDYWRHFPAYKLEPRLDIFLSICLPDIVKAFNPNLKESDLHVIPEFPIHKGVVFGEKRVGTCAIDNQSVKVDFAVFSKTEKKIYLVELKTDDKSLVFKKKCKNKDKPLVCTQLINLKKAIEANAHKVLEGVIECAVNNHVCTENPEVAPKLNSQKHKHKYAHLFWMLQERVGCIEGANFEALKGNSLIDLKPNKFVEAFKHIKVCDDWVSQKKRVDCMLIYPGRCKETREKLSNFLESFCFKSLKRIQFNHTTNKSDICLFNIVNIENLLLRRCLDSEAGEEPPWVIHRNSSDS